MKVPVIAAVLIGVLIGSAVTYSFMSQAGLSVPQSQSPRPDAETQAETQTPFESSEDDDEPDDYFRLLLTDPTNLIQRDTVIAMWYGNEHRTVNYLRVNTGHEFGPVWNQRSPVEILEEQLEFWRE